MQQGPPPPAMPSAAWSAPVHGHHQHHQQQQPPPQQQQPQQQQHAGQPQQQQQYPQYAAANTAAGFAPPPMPFQQQVPQSPAASYTPDNSFVGQHLLSPTGGGSNGSMYGSPVGTGGVGGALRGGGGAPANPNAWQHLPQQPQQLFTQQQQLQQFGSPTTLPPNPNPHPQGGGGGSQNQYYPPTQTQQQYPPYPPQPPQSQQQQQSLHNAPPPPPPTQQITQQQQQPPPQPNTNSNSGRVSSGSFAGVTSGGGTHAGIVSPKPQTPQPGGGGGGGSANASFASNQNAAGAGGTGSNNNSVAANPNSKAAHRARPVTTTGRRIDPSQVPTPARDLLQENASSPVRYASSKGVPPYGVANFAAVDDGNANPKFIRPSLTAMVHDDAFLKETALQQSIVLAPLAERPLHFPGSAINTTGIDERVPVVVGRPPVRCKRCRAYLSPNAATFIDLGRRWTCHLCDVTNDVDDEFFANLDNATGKRRDAAEKAELSRGSVEYDVTAYPEYALSTMLNPSSPTSATSNGGGANLSAAAAAKSSSVQQPLRPLHYLFVIDVARPDKVSSTQRCTQVDFLHDLQASLRSSLAQMSTAHPTCRVSFITYASTLHFYNFAHPHLPQMIVADIQNPFVPLPFTLLCWMTVGESMDKINQFLDMLPTFAQDAAESGSCLGAAIKVASLILSETGGKVVVTGSQLPKDGLGAITKPRDLAKLYGSANPSDEKALYRPQDGFFSTTAVECAKKQISFDLLFCPTEFCELVTVGQLCHLTNGQQFLFYNYDSDNEGHRLQAAVDGILLAEAGYGGILRVRCSRGLRVKQYAGHFLSQDAHDMDLAAIHDQSVFVVDLEHEGRLDPKQYVYVQAALLYTTRDGSRRVRVHTLKMPICNTYVSLFRNVDLEACLFSVIKDAVKDALNHGPAQARKNIFARLQKMLVSYRRYCSSGSHSGQLLMPELLKLLPLYSLALMKSDALVAGTTTRFDCRIQNLFELLSMPSYRVMPYLYPRFYALHNLYAHPTVGLYVNASEHNNTSGTNNNTDNGDAQPAVQMPPIMQLTADTVMTYGVYLLQDQQAHLCYLWIGSAVSPKSSMALFNTENTAEVGVSVHLDGFSDRLQNIILYVQNTFLSSGRDKLIIIHEKKGRSGGAGGAGAGGGGSGAEESFFRNMVEDENFPAAESYSDLLCTLHKAINTQLS